MMGHFNTLPVMRQNKHDGTLQHFACDEAKQTLNMTEMQIIISIVQHVKPGEQKKERN